MVVLGLVWLAREPMLRAIGGYLIQSDGPERADVALVLAGDAVGQRILRGAELKEQGFVPVVWVSGPAGMYGHTEDELAIEFAVKKGKPREWFQAAPNEATSTADEARLLLPRLRDAGVKRLLLVTSTYHTRRAGKIFRATAARIAPEISIRTVAATDRDYPPDRWWQLRQGRKVFFFEGAKTVTEWFGL